MNSGGTKLSKGDLALAKIYAAWPDAMDLLDWVEQNSLPVPEVMHEFVDPDTGALLGVIEVAWPNGLQEGLAQPVAVLLQEPEFVQRAVNQAGYLYFT
ncbi:MAG: hypothetical protein M5U22_18665 [Thermoleophilia bacterium]|nr:hypothetical protein [Thermoleophilia bacterium]